jgi:N-acetyl sugar amidotransferase
VSAVLQVESRIADQSKPVARQTCTRCIMDTTDPEIVFDANGVCHHCHAYDARAAVDLFDERTAAAKLQKVVEQIQADGRGKRYDCIIGVSGGVDSTMAAYVVKKAGLRPLAVHLDNGWNSELAVHNIERTLNCLGIELFTHVIDWEEFRDLQLSFLKASVANIEALTDHAINAILFKAASRHALKYVITGGNVVTEAVMPSSWMYESKDWRHIAGIQRRFGTRPVRSFPHCTLAEFAYYIFVKRIKYIPILNYVRYVKHDAKELIQRELGWRDYGGKHYESIFTRFFQGYILPRKFNMDKRRPHLSTLILSGQVTRDVALGEMTREPYDPEMLKEEMEFFLRKMALTSEQFAALMNLPINSHRDYPSHSYIFDSPRVIRMVKAIVRPKSLR